MQLHAVGLLAEVATQFLCGDLMAPIMHVAKDVADHQVKIGMRFDGQLHIEAFELLFVRETDRFMYFS